MAVNHCCIHHCAGSRDKTLKLWDVNVELGSRPEVLAPTATSAGEHKVIVSSASLTVAIIPSFQGHPLSTEYSRLHVCLLLR